MLHWFKSHIGQLLAPYQPQQPFFTGAVNKVWEWFSKTLASNDESLKCQANQTDGQPDQAPQEERFNACGLDLAEGHLAANSKEGGGHEELGQETAGGQ